MQPRSAPATCSVTNAAPGAASAGATGGWSSASPVAVVPVGDLRQHGGARVLEQQAPIGGGQRAG